MIYLAAKAPGDVADYDLNMSEFLPDGFSIDAVSVVVDAAGNSESPITLTAIDAISQPVEVGSPPQNIVILFWLTGGTPGVRYRGTITMSDNQSTDPDRETVRRFEVEVEDL